MLSQVQSDPIEHIDDIKADIPEYVEDADVEEQVDDDYDDEEMDNVKLLTIAQSTIQRDNCTGRADC